MTLGPCPRVAHLPAHHLKRYGQCQKDEGKSQHVGVHVSQQKAESRELVNGLDTHRIAQGIEFMVSVTLFDRQKQVILAGGMLNYVREQNV